MTHKLCAPFDRGNLKPCQYLKMKVHILVCVGGGGEGGILVGVLGEIGRLNE